VRLHKHPHGTLWRRTLVAGALVATLAGASISSQSASSQTLLHSVSTSRAALAHERSRPAFTSSVGRVVTAQLGATWHPGCPVAADQLRSVKMSYVGFDGTSHIGTMVVNESVVTSVIRVFRLLYEAGFPIKEMTPESDYDGNDNAAAAADDTSGFNCRYAVAPGPPKWSVHAYGEAIDVNDVQNPYIDGATIIPPSGALYRDRGDVRPGMAVPRGTLVDAFAAVGWYWGGRWTGSPDYQHFSLTGG
jgi:hypothetical protein